ncbi:hypothetical protein QWJ34_01615 [Saccharibacillus sp. CPCC 101409]|nr:hypothetical protein [Saccharibacillus sp. CPCC 101409]
MREIAPYFTKLLHVRDSEEQGENARQSLSLQNFRPEAHPLFEQTDTAVLPLMRDLYKHRKLEETHWENEKSRIRFQILTSSLEPLPAAQHRELEPLREFLLRTHFNLETPPEYGLFPLGWKLEDELKHSLILRFFAGFVPHLELYVDADTREVLLLLMSMSPIKHELTLERSVPAAPRVNRGYLYFEIGGETVLVVNLHALECKETLRSWRELEDARSYLRDEGVNFEEFDHEQNGELLEGTFFLFEQKDSDKMMEAINRAVEERRGRNELRS